MMDRPDEIVWKGYERWREWVVYADWLEGELERIKPAAQAVINNTWWHHGTQCVNEEDMDKLLAALENK
jgi:hypothetical protein